MDAFSREWYDGLYTMVAKPIKLLEFASYNDCVFNNNY